jgi:putative peptidoglycan lipid II flippase
MQEQSQPTSVARPVRRISVSQAALLMTASIFGARFLGLLRGSVFTAIFPFDWMTDSYNLAFQVPNLIYNVVAGGALISAFIPVFNHYIFQKDDEQEAWRLTSIALNLCAVLLIMLSILAILFADLLVSFDNPALHNPEQIRLTANLMRIMFLQAVVMGIGVVINAVLYARKEFFLPALAQLLYPVGMLIGLLPGLIIHWMGWRNDLLAIYCAAWGVVLAAVLMVAVQLPGLRNVGMRYSFSWQWRHAGVIRMVRMMIPRTINAIMLNISQAVDLFLITLLGVAGFVSYYTLAYGIVTIPLGLVMGVATALFPSMSEYIAQGDLRRFRAVVTDALRNILFVSIPVSIAMILLSLSLVQALYEHGLFSLRDSELTAIPLICYAIGLPGLAAVEILTRSFYALSDTKTPVTVSICQFVGKIILSVGLIIPAGWLGSLIHDSLLTTNMQRAAWGMAALAFATSLATLVEAVVLLWLLWRRVHELGLRSLFSFVNRALLATLVMCVMLVCAKMVLDSLMNTMVGGPDQTLNLWGILTVWVKLAVLCVVGACTYLKTARLLKLLDGGELAPVQRFLTRLRLAWL